jgi:hypothetical protein
MKIEIQIDKLTPCLVELATGDIKQTTFSVAAKSEVQNLRDSGWLFDWTSEELSKSIIYKLQLKDDNVIQGLVAVESYTGAIYVRLAESAPHNQPHNKKYDGVGGHLFAIAIKLSLAMGFGGFIFFEAKNQKLADHYTEKFGANHLKIRYHDFRMEIDGQAAQNIIDNYTLEGDLDVR